MTLDNYIHERKLIKEKREKYYQAITFPLFGAIALLDSAEIEKAQSGTAGINIASAVRAPEAASSLYSHLYSDLSPRQRNTILGLIDYLKMRLGSFDGDNSREDGWTEAMNAYNHKDYWPHVN